MDHFSAIMETSLGGDAGNIPNISVTISYGTGKGYTYSCYIILEGGEIRFKGDICYWIKGDDKIAGEFVEHLLDALLLVGGPIPLSEHYDDS